MTVVVAAMTERVVVHLASVKTLSQNNTLFQFVHFTIVSSCFLEENSVRIFLPVFSFVFHEMLVICLIFWVPLL